MIRIMNVNSKGFLIFVLAAILLMPAGMAYALDIDGTDDHDVIFGSAVFDKLVGKKGDDAIYGLGGPDEIFGNEGNDDIFGGDGDDSISGDDGNDTRRSARSWIADAHGRRLPAL